MHFLKRFKAWRQVNPLMLYMLLGLVCLPNLGCGQTSAEPAKARYTSQAFHLSGTWSSTGSPGAFHSSHTATLLTDGRVLAAGGAGELYDPILGTWDWTGNMVDSDRADVTSTLLTDGTVLVAGGIGSSGELDTSEVYDPTLNTWSATAGTLTDARAAHTATLLSNGKVLVAGGYTSSGEIGTAELYDPTTGTWSGTSSLATARSYHTATMLPNGKVLVTGGVDSSGDISSSELYDPTAGTWSSAASLPHGRYGHTATLMSNGKVLVTGGFGPDFLPYTDVYNPSTNTWSTTGSLNEARAYHAATVVPGPSNTERVLVAGGWSGGSSAFLSSAEVYNESTNTWSTTGSMSEERSFFTLTLMNDGTVLATGGYGGVNAASTAELYDP
jgi:N-acetylneuraminic acid mutarotase